MPLTFLVGGARSGKSTLAVQMGEHHGGPVHFIATAQAFDDDLRARVAATGLSDQRRGRRQKYHSSWRAPSPTHRPARS